MISTSNILLAGALFGAVSSMGYGTWKVLDYTELRPITLKEYHITQQQLDGLSNSYLLIRFQILMEKRKQQGLVSFEEQQEICRIARVLGYVGVPGC